MSMGETSTETYGFANSPVIVESFGNILGLGEDADDDAEVEGAGESVHEITPSRNISPVKHFMTKKYGFSGRTPKRYCLFNFEK